MSKRNTRSARTRAEMKALVGSRFPLVPVGLSLVAAVATASALVSLSAF